MTAIRRITPSNLEAVLHISVPFKYLQEGYADQFIRMKYNPEIGLSSDILDNTPDASFRQMAQKFTGAGLSMTFHGPFVDLSPGTPDAAVAAVTRRRFEQVLRLIPIFHPKTVVCHTGYDRKRYGYFWETWLANSTVHWVWFAKALEAEGVRLMLENVFEAGPHEMLPLLERIRASAPVGFCLDVGHHMAFSGTALSDWVSRMAGYLGQLHLHDTFGRLDNHLAPGKGIIDFHRLFALLKSLYAKPPWMTVEVHRSGDLESGIRHIEKLWPW